MATKRGCKNFRVTRSQKFEGNRPSKKIICDSKQVASFEWHFLVVCSIAKNSTFNAALSFGKSL
jgi:hypothetical protein